MWCHAGGGGSSSPAPTPGAGSSKLYIGYYAEDPTNNPEDPTVGAVLFNAPSGDAAFSGQMPFSYVGCAPGVAQNVGTISGNRSGNALTGNWSGTVDGTAAGGAFEGTYTAASDSFAGNFANAAGKVKVQIGPCQYYIAALGTWKVFGSLQNDPANFTTTVSASATPTFSWPSLGANIKYGVRVFDYACLQTNPANSACFFGEAFTTLTSINYPSLFPSAKALVAGTSYLLIVTAQNITTGAYTGFSASTFVASAA